MKLILILIFIVMCTSIPCIYIYPTIIPERNTYTLTFNNLTTQWTNILYTITNSYNGYSISYQYKDNILINYKDPFMVSVELYSFTLVPFDTIIYPCMIYNSPTMILTHNNTNMYYNPIIVYSHANQKNIILSILIWMVVSIISNSIFYICIFSICWCITIRKIKTYIKV